MKVVAISDTHGRHRDVSVPDGDVLIHAGDVTGRGEMRTIFDFVDWLKALPHEQKIVIAGNHDFCFEDARRGDAIEAILGVAEYLEDSALVLNGVKFYGSPWQPEFCDWAFNLPRGKALRERWDEIDPDTDVLITHGPPMGILDQCPGGNVGDADLLDAVMNHDKLRWHIFGHIHESYGETQLGGKSFINASTCNAKYMAWNKAIVFDVEAA